jgi:hypothetical protein
MLLFNNFLSGYITYVQEQVRNEIIIIIIIILLVGRSYNLWQHSVAPGEWKKFGWN